MENVSISPTNSKIPLGNKGNQARNNGRLLFMATTTTGKTYRTS